MKWYSRTLLLILCAWLEVTIAQAQSVGAVVAWGDNAYGQTTVPVAAQSGVAAIAAGGTDYDWFGNSHTVALKTNGSVVAWGDNAYGQTTVPAAAERGVTAIAAGGGPTRGLYKQRWVGCLGGENLRCEPRSVAGARGG